MAFPHILPAPAAQVWHLSQQLAQFERMSAPQQRSIQAQSLRTLYAWAAEYSPFWRERLEAVHWTRDSDPWAVLAGLPSLTRADVQENFDALSCAKALEPDSCSVAHSTGSTGRPVAVQRHGPTYHLRYAAHSLRGTIWHQLDVSRPLLKFGVRLHDGTSPDWGGPEAWFAKTGPVVRRRSIARDISELYEPIKTLHPGYIVGMASTAQTLARYALENYGADLPRIAAVLTTGETVTDQMRRECQAAFGARVINRYSNVEVGWMAMQCTKHEHLHVMAANVIIEIVDEAGQPCAAGQPGRVLVTALHSQAMPLIRYDVGDVAEWGEPCDCGIELPVLRRIWGRQREFVRVPTGELRFFAVAAEEFLAIAPIRDIRFRYYTNPLLRCEVVCTAPLTAEQRAALTARVRQMLGFECPVEIEQRDAIDWGATDKRASFLVMEAPWTGGASS